MKFCENSQSGKIHKLDGQYMKLLISLSGCDTCVTYLAIIIFCVKHQLKLKPYFLSTHGKCNCVLFPI